MNCDHCGKPVNMNAKFCGKCGAFLNFNKKIAADQISSTQSLESQSIEHIEQTVLFEQDLGEQQALAEQRVLELESAGVDVSGSVGAGTETNTATSSQDSTSHQEHDPAKVPVHTSSVSPSVESSVAHSLEEAPDKHVTSDHQQTTSVGAPHANTTIETLAPVLNNPIPVLHTEFAGSLDSIQRAIESMRAEVDAKVAGIKGDVLGTAQILAQRIQQNQTGSPVSELGAINTLLEQLRGELSMHFGELRASLASGGSLGGGTGVQDMQAILSAEFKKIQTGIVNLYNTQQNTIAKSNTAFEEAVAELTFKIQNIENFVNSQLANQAQAQSNVQNFNKNLAVAINEIRTQLQEQEELLSGLTIDPALIKTMNAFNVNFKKHQEQLAQSNIQSKASLKGSKGSDNATISDTLVMWFVGFLCGLTILLGGLSIYNYMSAQQVRAELKHKKLEENTKIKEELEHGEKIQDKEKSEKTQSDAKEERQEKVEVESGKEGARQSSKESGKEAVKEGGKEGGKEALKKESKSENHESSEGVKADNGAEKGKTAERQKEKSSGSGPMRVEAKGEAKVEAKGDEKGELKGEEKSTRKKPSTAEKE